MTHFPRVPMTLTYPDLVKSSLAGSSMTDNRVTEDLPEASRDPGYRTPPDRVNGNEVFRRMPNGMIDMPNAVSIVIDSLSQLKFGNPLNDLECSILCACFPAAMATHLPSVDAQVAKSEIKSKLRVSDQELAQIAMLASMKLVEMHEWLTFAIRV